MLRPNRWGWIFMGCLLALSVGLLGCDDDDDNGGEPDVTEEIRQLIETSLHNTTDGMEYFYAAENGGFEQMTGVGYDQLGCKNCHVEPEECGTCHVEDGDTPTADACFACHGRQNAEINHGFSDVHRDAGMTCADCHDGEDVHGDGNVYISMLEGNAIKARCENCHDPEDQEFPDNSYHNLHVSGSPEIACSGCHMQSVVTCYNCHFDSEIDINTKIAYGQFKNWRLLLKRDRGNGEVIIDSGNFQSLVFEDSLAFVAVAPYYAHTIASDAITSCDDCHDNEYVQEYNTNGTVTVATWNPDTQAMEPNIQGKGIIPVPPDWETALQFGFATMDPPPESPSDPRNWVEIDPAEMETQMLFAEPLDAMPE
ncbi:MAG: hypothetical protein GF355_04120 [Candidatus Eisenbacteria bacterium]|nr:hypothetical protein [Candidatus Eisenbacteria bacterium]